MIKVCDAIMGTGKAQPLDSLVLTDSGFREMGSINVGDKVFGEDGQLHSVLGVYPQGEKDVFRVTFTDGSSTKCCREHLWTYIFSNNPKSGCVYHTDTLEDLMNDHMCTADKTKCYIPMIKPIAFDRTWEFEDEAPDWFGYRLSSTDDPVQTLSEADKYKLETALISDSATRLLLMTGLLANKKRTVKALEGIYYTAPAAIEDYTRSLVLSMGGTAKKIGHYILHIQLPLSFMRILSHPISTDGCLFKCDDYGLDEGMFEDVVEPGPSRAICNTEYVGREICQCIYIDSQTHLYVTDDYIVTHNTSASIAYLNEHKDQKFIYITPYLDEAARIKAGCPDLKFREPSNKIRKYGFSKTNHTADLVSKGYNITTTHQAFKQYSQETLASIRDQGYTLIIDENVDILEEFKIHPDDLQLAVDAGYVSRNNGVYNIKNGDYHGVALRELMTIMKTRELIEIDKAQYYWTLPPELLTSFKDVFILTYLFKGQSLRYFMDIYHLDYEYIGIDKIGDNQYRFCEAPGYTPEYVSDIGKILHIIDSPKLNSVGDDYFALTKSWFCKQEALSGKGDISQLKNNLSNYFTNIHRDRSIDERLWSVYKDFQSVTQGKGYTKSFLTFNARATNEYRSRNCLAYIPNVFMNVGEKLFYQAHGAEVDEDTYALSVMIQWIWRSAIRDGGEVDLYIPSRRMRTLLRNWIKSLDRKDGESIEV